jgi:sugar phosphate isomerase/epimerase
VRDRILPNMTSSRRQFLKTTLASVAALTTRRQRLDSALVQATLGHRLRTLGIQVTALHADLNKNFSGTLAHIAAMGYREIELVWWFGNFDRSPMQLRTALDAAGLRAPSAHISAAALAVGWDRRLEQAHTLGHEYLFCTNFDTDTQTSLDDWREWADRLNRVGETARRAGIWVGLHNEDTGFQPIDGQVPYDVFLDHTDPAVTRHQLDTGNLASAGRDPMEYVRRYGNRYGSFHIKDRPKSSNGSNVPGDGTINFRQFLSVVPEFDNKHFVVEFDAENRALVEAARSYRYLHSLDF